MPVNDNEMARLRWRCRRGMLELDLLLQAFLEQHYPLLERNQQEQFAKLLTLPDQQLFDCLLGGMEPSEKEFTDVIDRIRHASAA